MLYLPKHDFSRAGFCRECVSILVLPRKGVRTSEPPRSDVRVTSCVSISQGGSRPGSVASGAKEKSDMAKEKLIAASWECTEKLLTNPSLGRKDYGKNSRNSGSRRGAPPFFSGGTGGAPAPFWGAPRQNRDAGVQFPYGFLTIRTYFFACTPRLYNIKRGKYTDWCPSDLEF